MRIGNMIWDKCDKRYGILIEEEWTSNIGTPFDWLVMYFDDGSLWGCDERDMLVLQ
jgi:hypothetical protein